MRGGDDTPQDKILGDLGKEQLHLLLMILCVFLHKFYISSQIEPLYPEEVKNVQDILLEVKTHHETILKEMFGVEGELIKPDEKRVAKLKTVFSSQDAIENIDAYLQGACEGECVVNIDVDSNYDTSQLTGELFRQVSFKFRLVQFLGDFIALLDEFADKDTPEDAKQKILIGKIIETKLKMWYQYSSTTRLVKGVAYTIADIYKAIGKSIMPNFGKPKRTCKRETKMKGGDALNDVKTRVTSLLSKQDENVQNKYAFLLYFKSFMTFYKDNMNSKMKIKNQAEKMTVMEKIMKLIYNQFMSVNRMFVKNQFNSIILFGSVIASITVSIVAHSQPMYTPIWIAKQVMSAEAKIVPVALAPFVDNPLMPIFRKDDIRFYNNELGVQSGKKTDIGRIAKLSERYIRLAILVLKQPFKVQFKNKPAVDLTVNDEKTIIQDQLKQ
jgi:hypothetical protein